MAKPKLRFPEFTDEWNEKTLDKLFEYKNGDSLENSLDENGNYYLISLNSIDKNGNLQNKLKRVINAKWFLKKNDIVMVLSDIGKGNFLGLSEIIPEDNKYVLNQRMGLLRAKAEINITYARAYINFSQKYFKSCGQGSAQLNISKGDVLRFVLKIPCIKEQQKIADFLSKVDKKIANQEAVVSDYEELKKGLMQKIFSQEIRFKADDGSEYPEWEEKKLLEIATIYDGTHQTPNYVEQGIPFVSVENIKNLYKTNKYITKEAFEKEFKIYPEKGDILMTRIGDIGTASLVSRNMKIAYYVSLALLKPQENILADYLVQYISNTCFQKELWKRTLHIAFPKKINKGEIGECKVKAPCLEEQQKIADCLSAMDRKIEAEKKILKDWKELKKALLQQMFV
ncbi:restriction endonuclease subunit S [Thomasclavelia cocleata]|uniref:restriction endonuclease subunit S n=1 Tax=Thomasclavelia cocleata TaxID=69824 RepID=UPI00256EB605|nr:restriction endonuclease subunit S [Thomasclavelia cocleata]